MSYCGGTWVSETEIITAKHCVDDEEDGLVEFQMYYDFDNHYPLSENDTVYVAEIVDTGATNGDSVMDLALLRSVDKIKHGIAPIARYDIPLGMDTLIIGHPKGMQFAPTKGVISGDRMYLLLPTFTERHVLHITFLGTFGNSGGGAFDMSGQLLGILSFMKDPSESPGQMFAVHRDDIRYFLDQNHVKYR